MNEFGDKVVELRRGDLPVRLTALNGHLLRKGMDPSDGFSLCETVHGAHGVIFDCPCMKCGAGILIWFETPQGIAPVSVKEEPRARWTHTGTTLEDLSLGRDLVTDCWEGVLVNGEVKRKAVKNPEPPRAA